MKKKNTQMKLRLKKKCTGNSIPLVRLLSDLERNAQREHRTYEIRSKG